MSLLAAAAACALLAACGSSSAKTARTNTSSSNVPTTSSSAGAGRTTLAGCTSVAAPAPRNEGHVPPPTTRLTRTRQYTVRLTTNCGVIEIHLDVARAPKTASSFAYLVKRGFYNHLTFHRIAGGFVIQGGDPAGNGTGGVDYQVVEPPPASLQYTPGIVAMAKTQTEPSGASGSQFFIVIGNATQLPPQYALVGEVTKGLAVAQRIGTIPTNPPGDGMPQIPVVIEQAVLIGG